MRNRHRLAATVVFVLAVAGLGTATPTQAQTPGPIFSVEPSTDLIDGQSIHYEGSGFAPGSTWSVLQCVGGASDLTGVLATCAIRHSVGADATGSFSGFVTFSRTFRPMSGSETIDCATVPEGCAISVFNGASTVIEARVAYADQPVISVSQTSGLEDGDVVTVTGSNFPAGAAVNVAQCVTNQPTTADWCDDRPPVSATADATGAFVVEVAIHRGVTTPSGLVTDCSAEASTPCAIAAYTGDGTSAATMPIGLTFRTILATTASPLEVSPQGTVDVAGALFCLPATSRAFQVSGVITQTVDDRVITEAFDVTTSCPENLATWSTQVGGVQTQRFKAGPASVTTWVVEEADPLPDDAYRASTTVELVRPAAPGLAASPPGEGPQ